MKKIIIGFLLILGYGYAIETGKVPAKVAIDGKNGGVVSGSGWSSEMLKDKVTVLFYVDPDKKDDNNALSQALKSKHFDRKRYRSVAIVNLAATWLPDAVIEAKLSKKQKEFPDTIYVKDKNRVLVKEWNLKDDSSDVLLFDKSGKLIYKKFGKLNRKEIGEVISLIEQNL
jgi:YtfJ family uncharacterized protein